jgi:hypothetical protein
MLNISKHQTVLFACSALVAASLGGFVRPVTAQTVPTNNSNATGTNVTTTTGGSIPQPSGPVGVSPDTISRIDSFNQRISVAQTAADQTSADVAKLDIPPTAAVDTSPVRYAVEKGVADLASCGCPDANAIGSTTPTTPSPELVAAREAEAKAAAELAAAKAEARQFIESVKSGQNASSRTVDTSLW